MQTAAAINKLCLQVFLVETMELQWSDPWQGRHGACSGADFNWSSSNKCLPAPRVLCILLKVLSLFSCRVFLFLYNCFNVGLYGVETCSTRPRELWLSQMGVRACEGSHAIGAPLLVQTQVLSLPKVILGPFPLDFRAVSRSLLDFTIAFRPPVDQQRYLPSIGSGSSHDDSNTLMLVPPELTKTARPADVKLLPVVAFVPTWYAGLGEQVQQSVLSI